jgi:TetR/AcrR family transcriptional regulator, mexCD-oprJ operon repressor
MSQRPAPRQALQQRVADAILEAAAGVLSTQGDQASMSDVAAAAGVARATVYRYFPNRRSLLDELAELAVNTAGERLASARLDQIALDDGIARAVRALVAVGDLLIVLAREQLRANPEQFDRHVAGPLRRLIERGQATGAIRDDMPSAWLTDSLVAVAVSVLSSRPSLGQEDTVAAITSFFLDGARGASSRLSLS